MFLAYTTLSPAANRFPLPWTSGGGNGGYQSLLPFCGAFQQTSTPGPWGLADEPLRNFWPRLRILRRRRGGTFSPGEFGGVPLF